MDADAAGSVRSTRHATPCGQLQINFRAARPGRSASTAGSASRSGFRCARSECDRSIDMIATAIRECPRQQTAAIACLITAAVPVRANEGSNESLSQVNQDTHNSAPPGLNQDTHNSAQVRIRTPTILSRPPEAAKTGTPKTKPGHPQLFRLFVNSCG